jgi:hypothetical protein
MKNKKIIIGLLGILLVISIFLLGPYTGMKENQLLQKPLYTPTLPPLTATENPIDELKKAKERVSFNILEPRYLPDNFELIGLRIDKEVNVMLIYEDPTGRRVAISEWEAKGYEHRPYPGEEEVTINETTGFFSTPGPYNLLWKCNNLIISLTADLTGDRESVKNEMVKIAKSFQC